MLTGVAGSVGEFSTFRNNTFRDESDFVMELPGISREDLTATRVGEDKELL